MCNVCAAINPHHPNCDYEGLLDNSPGVGVLGAPSSYADAGETLFETADAAASTATAYEMEVGDYFMGDLDSLTDSDFIAITLEAGQQYTAAIMGNGPLSEPLTDSFLRIYDENGTLLHSDDDDGPQRHSQHTFTATYSGT